MSAPSSNRTCSFPAYGSPCGTGFISFAPLRPSAPFHIDSDGCSSIWTSGFRRAATERIVPYYSLSALLFSPFDLHRPFYTQRPFAPLLGHRFATRCRSGIPTVIARFSATMASSDSSLRFRAPACAPFGFGLRRRFPSSSALRCIPARSPKFPC